LLVLVGSERRLGGKLFALDAKVSNMEASTSYLAASALALRVRAALLHLICARAKECGKEKTAGLIKYDFRRKRKNVFTENSIIIWDQLRIFHP
jgi:hypothetical protein